MPNRTIPACPIPKHVKEQCEDLDCQRDGDGIGALWPARDPVASANRAMSPGCAHYNASTVVAPAVFVLGCGKCATTTLHALLVRHRAVLAGCGWPDESGIEGKEQHFFDDGAPSSISHASPHRSYRGVGRYLCHFPRRRNPAAPEEERFVSVDATPDYLPSWRAPLRLKRAWAALRAGGGALPWQSGRAGGQGQPRFVIVLRDPSDRLWPVAVRGTPGCNESALRCTATAWILIVAQCAAIP